MIKPKTQTNVKGKDNVEKLKRILASAKNAYVTIGLHEGAGTYSKSNVDVVQVGLWNEFGTKDVPERSFFRTAVGENEGLINTWREEMIDGLLQGKVDVKKALDTIGFRIMTLIQNKIKTNVPPPYGTGRHGNSSKEVEQAQARKRKRGVAPVTLIETGLMLRSVSWKTYLK